MQAVHGYRFDVLAEERLDRDLRRRIATLLEATLDDGTAYAGRAWRTLAPFERVVAMAGGEVVGNASLFRVPCRPAGKVAGLGDVAVDPRHRRRGIARRLCGLGTAACWRDGSDAVIAKTKPLRGVLADLGFVAVDDLSFYYRDGDRRERDPDWMAVTAGRLPPAVELLQGDF
jgi:GNAT superfamily N-acetyltransferase